MESPFKGKTGLKRLINAFGYSIEGFKSAFKNEDAFRQELILAIILIPTGILIGENGFQKALLVSSILAVLIVELDRKSTRLNSSHSQQSRMPSSA